MSMNNRRRRRKSQTPIIIPIGLLLLIMLASAVVAGIVVSRRAARRQAESTASQENTGDTSDKEYLEKEKDFKPCYIMTRCREEDQITADRVPGNPGKKSVLLTEGKILLATEKGTADGESYYHLDDGTYVIADDTWFIHLQSYKPLEGYIVISYVSTKGVNLRAWADFSSTDNIVGSAFVGDRLNITGKVLTESGDSAFQTEDGLYITTDPGYSQNFTTDPAAETNTGDESTQKEDGSGKEEKKEGKIVCLDPGHQGPDVDMSASEPNAPGSDVMKRKATEGATGSYTGVGEYQLNLDIALLVRDGLEAKGYQVIMTREDNDKAISNAERAQLANDSGAAISVRLHADSADSSDVSGAHVLIGSEDNPYVGDLYSESYKLGNSVLDAYCKSTGMRNRGIVTDDSMTGINWSKVPVIILEMGFMSNKEDDTNMQDKEYQQKMADGIVEGIDNYLKDTGE